MRRFHTYIGVIMTDSNFNNPYEQIWKTRNLRDLNTNVELDNQRSEFRRGLGAFGKEMQATGYGLAALGAQGLENVIGENDVTSGIVDWGLKGYNKSIEESQSGLNAPSVANIEGIKTASDAMDWAGYQLGKGLPMLGSLALSGGIGGAVARLGAKEGVKQLAKSAVGSAVKKGVETKALKVAEGQVVTKAMQEAAAKSLRDTITKGAVAGGFAGSFGLEGGLAFGEQTAEGVNPADAVKSAIAVGGINGALEFLPFYSAAKSIGLGQYAKKSISSIIKNSPDLSKTAINLAKEVGGRATKGAIVGAGAEGITEGLQELVSIAGLRWAQQDPIFADLSDEDWTRIGNAAAAGALVGGVAMGAGATLGGPQVQSTNTPQNESTLTGEVIPKENKLLGVNKTKQQVIEGVLEKVNADLVIAQEEGNIAKVEELQRAKDIYENTLEQIREKITSGIVTESVPITQEKITQPRQDAQSVVQPEIQQAVESLRERQEPVNIESVQKELAVIRQTVLDQVDNAEIVNSLTETQEQDLANKSELSDLTEIPSFDLSAFDNVTPEDSTIKATQPTQDNTISTLDLENTIDLAVQDGKDFSNLTKLVNDFSLGNLDSKWNMEHTPGEPIKVKSIKEGIGGPQWELSIDDLTGNATINQKINNKQYSEPGLAQYKYSSAALSKVSPWVMAEIMADVQSGMTNNEVNSKWNFNDQNVEIDILVNAVETNSLSPFILAEALNTLLPSNNSKVILPEPGQLEYYIQNGLEVPQELGGNKAKTLVAKGFAPNTVETFVNKAVPGWNLEALSVADGKLYADYFSDDLTKHAEWVDGKFKTAGNFYDELPVINVPNTVIFEAIDDAITNNSTDDVISTVQNLLDNIAPGWSAKTHPDGALFTDGISNIKITLGDPAPFLYISPEEMLVFTNAEELQQKLLADNTVQPAPFDLQSTDNTQVVQTPTNTSWSPTTPPNGYDLNDQFTITTPEGQKLQVEYGLTDEQKSEIAHIYNHLKLAQMAPNKKLELFKNLPTNAQALAEFKANNPYLLRKVSIDEATTLEHGKELLNDIVTRRDKYSFDEILNESIKFKDKYGEEELVAALASAPKEIYQPPHLDGWLTNMRTEEELLNENPFEGIWAEYAVNKGPNESAARYGVIIINPKTGKVLLRKVANQFEGITWDFARGGADRFGTPDAKPHLIDTNALGGNQVADSKRYMEHPLIAAKREAKEEFGYDVQVIGQLAKGFYTSLNSYESGMASLYYVAVATSEQTDEHLNPTHGIKETDETKWVDIHEARQLISTEPTLPLNPGMKRDGYHKPRLARIGRTLEAVYNPAMQYSDLDYRGSTIAMENYYDNGFFNEFPGLISKTNKSFNELTELQKMQVAAALYVSKRFPNADAITKTKLQKEVFVKRATALKAWLKSKIGTTSVSNILNGNSHIGTIQNTVNKNGGKIVLSLWHGSNKSKETLIDDVINPIYLGMGWGGHDTKEGLYLTDTEEHAINWGEKKQINILVAFNNLKVIPGSTNYANANFTNIIKTAKQEGYDGVLFDNVIDTHNGRQVVAWNAENMTAGGGVGVGFTGQTLYQSKGELKEAIDIDTAKMVLEDTFGNVTQKMLDSGLLELVESGGPDGVAGQYFGDEQKIRIYMDYISSPRELIGAVLHESSHAGMIDILGKSTQVYHEELLNSTNPLMRSAVYKTTLEGAQRFGIENILTPENATEIERVRNKLKEYDPNFLIEEDLANYVQQADTKSSLWQKLVTAIKVWWAKSNLGKALKERGIGFELTEDMIVGLATSIMQSQSVRRGNDYSTYVGHVSGGNWKSSTKFPYGKPDLKFVLAGKGEGFIKYGWGFYALEATPTFKYYKSQIGNKTYGLHFPDDIPPRMIEWDRPLSQQSSIVRDAITSPRDNYLLLRMAVKSKDKITTHSDGTLSDAGVGGSLYNELRNYYVKTKYDNDPYGSMFDSETNKYQKKKNLARRDASRKLVEYGLSGIRLLDAGSRFVTITKQVDGKYSVTQGKGNTLKTKVFSEKDFTKYVGPELAEKGKQQQIGQAVKHTGFGFYNWVFWRQSDLDRFTVVHKDGNQVADKPSKNASYDPNGIGIAYAESPDFADYVINPKTGDTKYLSQSEQSIAIEKEDLRDSIDSVMGKGWLQQAEQSGLIEVIEGVGPNNEAGSWAGDKIRLYTGSMPVGGSPLGVLLHEGKHATFNEVLGKTLKLYTKDLYTLAESGNQSARDAIVHATIASADILGIKHNLREGGTREDLDTVRAAIEEKQPGLLAEEELAYFVQYGSENQSGVGFLRRLINQIKAWFAQTKLGQRLKEMNVGFEMTEEMAVEWAKMGLHKSLDKLRQNERTNAQVLYKAAYMAPGARLGEALDNTINDPLYSMGVKEFKETLWNDPTDVRQEIVNKPGLLQRWRADFVDFFAEIEKKAPDIYDTFSLMRNKKAARVEQAHQEYLLPLRNIIVNSPWTSQEVGDMLAARHLKLDNVNLGLAERASDDYVRRLITKLPENKTQGIVSQARKNIKAGKMPDGSAYLDNNGQPDDMSAKTKRKLMFDLMNQYASLEIPVNGKQELLEEWERFKDAAGGFSSGGVAKGMVRTIDEVLELSKKDQAKFDEITKVFDAMNRHTLQILEDGGLITASEHARLLADKTAYAPLRRESYDVNREIELLFQRAGQGGSKQISTRTGTAALSEPTLVLQNALAQVETAAAAAERNLANTELYKTVVADKKGWQPWFSIVDKDKYTTHDEDGFLQEKNATASNKADINLIYKGKKVVIRPNMHNERAIGFVRAVNNLDAQILSGPMKVMNWVNGIVRWVNVSASPIFLMMNAVRDPFTAAYNMQASEAAPYTKEIFENYGKSFRALNKVFMQGNRNPTDADVQLVEAFENAGGRTSFIESLKAMDSTWRSFDGQVALRKGNFKHLMSIKDKWIDGIENFNILFENVMRLSTFSTLVSKGISEQRAARIAQDLTTNFTRRGYKTQALGTWWLFFNATVQGNYQVVRNLMSSARVQTAVGGTIAFALMLDLFSRAVAPDDWDKIPAWDKERFIVLPIKIGGDFVKIPSPWVFNVFWRMGGLLGETLSGVSKPQDTALDIAAMVSTTFSPIGRPGSFAQAVAPTAADPFVQILENKDFAGNPLGPEGYPGASKKANSELIWNNTPKGYQSFARWVNEATGGSAVESGGIDLRPADYQLLAKFLTGSLGRFMSDATFGVKKALTQGIEGPKDIPIIKELFSDPYDPIKTQKYHENVAGIYGAKRLEQMYLKGPERDLIKLHEIRQTRGTELGMYAQAQDVERQLKSLRTRIKAAQNRKDETRVNELRGRIGRIQEQFNQRVEQRMK